MTYVERKVIQLARLYVSVKRVFLDTPGGGRTRKDEIPRYHERNVIAYPQGSEVVQTLSGFHSKDLPSILSVQFVGGDRSRLRHQATLSVDVARLRTAFTWLTSNCWKWMELTKHDLVASDSGLGERLEHLLRAYQTSVGSEFAAVPAELIQAATKLDPSKAAVQQRGPSDAVAGQDLDGEEEGAIDAPLDDCGAVLQGGVDHLCPLKLWDSLMKKHRVLEEAEASGDQDDYANAVAAAAKALTRLSNQETRAKLER